MGARIELELLEKIVKNDNKILDDTIAFGDGQIFSDYSSIAQHKTNVQLAEKIGVLNQVRADGLSVPRPNINKILVKYTATYVGNYPSATLTLKFITHKGDKRYDTITTHLLTKGQTVNIVDEVEFNEGKVDWYSMRFILDKYEEEYNVNCLLEDIFVGFPFSDFNSYDDKNGDGITHPAEIWEEFSPYLYYHSIETTLGGWANASGGNLVSTYKIGREITTLGVGLMAKADSITVDWYKAEAKVYSQTITGRGELDYYFITHNETYDKVTVTLSCKVGYARLYKIDFGKTITVRGDEVENCKILEQEDVTALTLPSNYCDFTIVSPLFNIWNETEELKALVEGTKVHVYYDDEETTYLGMFLAKDIESRDDGSCHIRAYDWLYVLSQYKANYGLTASGEDIIYNTGASVWHREISSLIKDLFDERNLPPSVPLEIIDYQYKVDTYSSCYLDGGSVRDMIAYALANAEEHGVKAITSRRDNIFIAKSDYGKKSGVFLEDDYFENPKITIDKKPTTVIANYRNFKETTKKQELFKGILASDTWIYSTVFTSAIDTYDASGWRGFNEHSYSIKVTGGADEVRVEATVQDETNAQVSITQEANYQKQIAVDTHCTNGVVAQNIARRVADFYNKEYIIDFETEFDDLLCGDSVTIALNDNTFVGTLLQQEIDVTGGLLLKRKMRGERITRDYTTEFYTGERGYE